MLFWTSNIAKIDVHVAFLLYELESYFLIDLDIGCSTLYYALSYHYKFQIVQMGPFGDIDNLLFWSIT